MIQVQVCSRRPPPASPRASRKFASSELRDSESGGSDVSDKLSLLAADNAADRRSAARVKSCGVARKSSPVSAVAAATSSSSSSTGGDTTPRRPSPKTSPNQPSNHSIAEEVPDVLHQPTKANNHPAEPATIDTQESSNQQQQQQQVMNEQNNLEKMNVQNGMSSEQRGDNGNAPPASIVPPPVNNETDTTTSSSSPPDGTAAVVKALTGNKSSNKSRSTRGDSTDALLSDEDKSPVDENNPVD